MDHKPANACHRCGATAYKPVIVRDASGAMSPSGVYRCVGCKLEFQHINEWRASAVTQAQAAHLGLLQLPAV